MSADQKKKTIDQKMQEAHNCGVKYAAMWPSDPFAYARAHSRVMNGTITERDLAGQLRVEI